MGAVSDSGPHTYAAGAFTQPHSKISPPTAPLVLGNTPARAEAFADTRLRLITIPWASGTELLNNPKGKKSPGLNLQDLA